LLQVDEALATLNGNGPEDLVELVAELGGQLLHLKHLSRDPKEGAASVQKSLQDGSALRHFETMLKCQGVDETLAASLCGPGGAAHLPTVPGTQITALQAHSDGVVDDVDALVVARACRDLGAGRKRSDDVIDLRVGVRILTPVGTRVRRGDSLALVYHAEPELRAALKSSLQSAFFIRAECSQGNESPVICVI